MDEYIKIHTNRDTDCSAILQAKLWIFHSRCQKNAYREIIFQIMPFIQWQTYIKIIQILCHCNRHLKNFRAFHSEYFIAYIACNVRIFSFLNSPLQDWLYFSPLHILTVFFWRTKTSYCQIHRTLNHISTWLQWWHDTQISKLGCLGILL